MSDEKPIGWTRESSMRSLRCRNLSALLFLLCSGCVVLYSGGARARIQKNFLHQQVEVKRQCLLVEYVGASGSPALSLYDERGRPTQYVSYELYWLTGLFRKPDYRRGDHDFFAISRFPERLYYLSTNQTPFLLHSPIRVYPIHEYTPEEKLTLGPLGEYQIDKGTRVLVKGFKSRWSGGDSLSPLREELNVY